MSSEIVVPETPNWLQALEEKRELRLKAKLGHEAGAGAPCIKCGDKCPGLDLHFWRKACKICRCPKEEHDVHDDDIYGWAQFQLLGSKPNKIKTKIVLPGKKDEVELEWAPKGHKDTIEKYLKTLPPESLPVKGSQAAQDRKQLLQKQLPMHDIDPSLCHELNEDELKKMEEYIAHVKQSSVGVGQIVSLSSVIKGNLHNIAPHEAAIIATRYPKGIPLSQIVKLQCNIAKNLEKQLHISDTASRNQRQLSNLTPNQTIVAQDYAQSPLASLKTKDLTYGGYSTDINRQLPNTQYAKAFSRHPVQPNDNQSHPQYDIDEKMLQGTNFDPSKTPSQFVPKISGQFQNRPDFSNESLPYSTISDPSKSLFVDSHDNSNANKSFSVLIKRFDSPNKGQNKKSSPTNSKTPLNVQYGYENPLFKNAPKGLNYGNSQESTDQNLIIPNALKTNPPALPNYAPHKHNIYSETQQPRAPKSVKDLAFSTYDPTNIDLDELGETQGKQIDSQIKPNMPYDPRLEHLNMYDQNTVYSVPFEQSSGEYYPSNSSDVVIFDPSANQTESSNLSNKLPNTYLPEIPSNMPYDRNNVPYNLSNNPHAQNFDLHDPRNISDNKTPYDPNSGQFGSNNSEKYDRHNARNSNLPYDPSKGQSSLPHDVIRGSTPSDSFAGQILTPYEPTKGQNSMPYDPALGYGTVPYDTSNDQSKIPYDPSRGQSSLPYDLIRGSVPYDPSESQSLTRPTKGHSSLPYDPTKSQTISYDPAGDQSKLRYDPSTGQNASYDPSKAQHSPYDQGKTRKPLAQLQPGNINISEDYLHPNQVNIGAIKDISYPEIKAATEGTNDFFEDYSPESIREILNNVKLPDCHYCKKPFDENEFAVTIDRANVLFHAQCFKCAGCNQSLADNVYFYHKESDNIYCGRDYAKIRGIPRCKACDELIFTKEYCLAENSTFHLKHFCCIQCDIPLAGQDYTLEDEMPYCLPCFENSKASKCSSCSRVIKPDEIGCALNGIHFHAVDECFACRVCKKPLMGKKMLLRNEKLYCSHDCFNSVK